MTASRLAFLSRSTLTSLSLWSAVMLLTFLAAAPFAVADEIGGNDPIINDPIISIQSFQTSCNVVGLASSPATSTGGVHCAAAPNVPFSLTGILNGTLMLFVGNSSTPSWNVINDTGAPITSLTLFYSGALGSGSEVNAQNQGGSPFNMCNIVDHNGVVTAGCSNNTAMNPALPLEITWFTNGAGVPINGTFNINTASFAHAGADAGCISGQANCMPEEVIPEPGSLALFGSGLCGIALTMRRRKLRRH